MICNPSGLMRAGHPQQPQGALTPSAIGVNIWESDREQIRIKSASGPGHKLRRGVFAGVQLALVHLDQVLGLAAGAMDHVMDALGRDALAPDLYLRLNLDWEVERQFADANNCSGVVSDVRAKQIKDQVREAVHHGRQLLEGWRRVDHSEHPDPRRYPVEIAECPCETAQHCQGREPR